MGNRSCIFMTQLATMNANKTCMKLRMTSRCEFIAICIWLLLLLVSVAGCGAGDPGASSESTSFANTPSDQPGLVKGDSDSIANDELSAAKDFFDKDDLDSAFRLLSKLLIKTPKDGQTLLLASRVELAKGNRVTAIELAESVALDSPQAVEATNLLVQLYVKANQPEDAVERLALALDATSGSASLAVAWRHQSWTLLNRMGRRQEASVQADVLCRLGHYNRGLLISLLRRNESFPMVLDGKVLDGKAPQNLFYPGMGMARWFFSQGEFEQALKQLAAEKVSGFSSPAARALYGRLLAETQATNEFVQFYQACDAETRRFSDYWIALGIYFFDQQQLGASARALLEGILVDPTDDDACHRLARVLAALDRAEDSAAMREHAIRVALLRDLVSQLSLHQSNPELTGDLPEKLITLGRPFESIGWALIDLSPLNVAKRNGLIQQRDYLRSRPETLGMASEVARMEIDRNDFSIDAASEALAAAATGAEPANPDSTLTGPAQDRPMGVTPAFENVAAKRGVDFQWYHAKEINLTSIPLHEMMGGGIGVCDYDLDGYPDIYLGQGSGDPPREQCTRSNQLLRNLGGRFSQVTIAAAAEDFHYSSGIAAGDVNQDGFPDLFLGAIGGNRLLVNNGDGTFRDSTDVLAASSPQFTSSVAIADLTGDAIPELFECVYVEMEDAFRLPDRDADGNEIVPNPNDFFPEADRWYFNKGDGTFESRVIDRNRIQPGTSLGLVITDIDSDGSNDVFISNDARPNHLLVHFGKPSIQNIAVLRGVAYGFRGFSNACMGIAAGDFNRDGRIDLNITNYASEPNNHFLQGENGVFSDYATRYQLNTISEPYVGFGIKAIDFNRNGWLDLFVTNGHVFDQRHRGKSFQMPPQLVLNQATKFILSDVIDPSDYWVGQYLGRSVAKFDFDRDLDMDLLVGHLDAPLALLANQTQGPGSSFQLQLIGTESERDAIGTRVVVTASGKQWTEWVTAGDGFLSTDEAVLDFGLGQAEQIESIEIDWISGRQQIFREIAANHRYLAVEGGAVLWAQ